VEADNKNVDYKALAEQIVKKKMDKMKDSSYGIDLN
jgi:hypothetical protein